jgi:hypothetical protein
MHFSQAQHIKLDRITFVTITGNLCNYDSERYKYCEQLSSSNNYFEQRETKGKKEAQVEGVEQT